MGLIKKLQRYGDLEDEDQMALISAFAAVRRFEPGDDIISEGDRSGFCHVLVEGQAFRHRTLADGRRQILSFLNRGDVADLQSLFLPMDHSVAVLTRCETALVPHARLQELMASRPSLDAAMWRATLAEAAVFREWMVGMGRRTAFVRIAHFFCEIFLQHRAAGLVDENRCRFPVTQQHISDSLGLSTVHTNRTLQALRSAGLISFRGGVLTVLNWRGLVAAGEFDAAYLHLDLAA